MFPRVIIAVVAVVVAVSCCAISGEMPYGSFIGTVKTEWIRGPESERRMQLLQDFAYIDPKGRKWLAPAGSKTDGATIPHPPWSFVGGLFDGQYSEAAVIHDVYCDTKTEPWRDVHRIFYYASRAAGVSELKAKTMYTAVMIGGPKWGDNKSKCFNCHDTDSTKVVADRNGQLTAYPPFSEADMRKVIDWVGTTNPSLEEIDAYVKKNYPQSK